MRKLLFLLLVPSIAFAQVTPEDLMGLGMPANLATKVASIGTGSAVMNNNSALKWENAAGTGTVSAVNVTAADTLELRSGSTAGADVNLRATDDINLVTNSLTRWVVTDAGTLLNDSGTGGNIQFAKSFTGITENLTTVVAAGSTQADATPIGASVNYVTGADATKGIKLTATSGFTSGHILKIHNASASTLKLYSNAAGELINGVAGTTAYSVAARDTLLCFMYNSTNWACG